MFTNFDYSYFPYVIVKLNETIKDDDDFNYFLNKWSELYLKKKKFIFIFDTTNVGLPQIKYCFKLSFFIKELKKQKIQYLQKSIITVNSKSVEYLLNLIFKLQSPVAEVLLTDEKLDSIINCIKNKNIDNIKIKNKILPKKYFFDIFN